MSSKAGSGWPIGIFVFYGLFVAVLMIAVFITLNNDMEMVTNNYYEKTLKYEDQITRIKNTNALKEKPGIAFSSDKTVLILYMPAISGKRNFTGTIYLFRPSNFKLDEKYAIQLDNQGKQFIPLSSLKTGKWEIQIQWTDGHKEYYFEKVLII